MRIRVKNRLLNDYGMVYDVHVIERKANGIVTEQDGEQMFITWDDAEEVQDDKTSESP